jgi:hypothetical protein
MSHVNRLEGQQVDAIPGPAPVAPPRPADAVALAPLDAVELHAPSFPALFYAWWHSGNPSVADLMNAVREQIQADARGATMAQANLDPRRALALLEG